MKGEMKEGKEEEGRKRRREEQGSLKVLQVVNSGSLSQSVSSRYRET